VRKAARSIPVSGRVNGPVTRSPPTITTLPNHDSPNHGSRRRTTSPQIDGGPSGRTWRQWFVPSRVTSAFFAFNTLFWLFMILARYEYNLNSAADGLNAFARPIARGCLGFLFSCVCHFIVSGPWLVNYPWQRRVVIGVGIASAMAMGVFLVESLSPAAPVLPRLIVTWLWCGLYFGLEANDNQSRAERAAAENVARTALAEAATREIELRHLEAQMNPHFLFNALNCIVDARRDPDAVERVTQDLADYLRFSLRESRPLEPLSRELDALENYLGVQQSRFGDGLVCLIDCEPEARSVPVPPMMIQPLLENAFRYGAQTSPKPLTVNVAAELTNGWLTVSVVNTGAWVSPDSRRSPGSGLQTLRKRLGLLIGDEATVEIDTGQSSVSIRIRLPDTRPPGAASPGAASRPDRSGQVDI